MATVVKSSKASVDTTTGMVAPIVSGLRAGEDIPSPMTPCQIKADGKVWRASGAAADSNARIAGWSTRANVKAGAAVTLMGVGLVGKYADGTLTPGNVYYLSATTGALDTVATTGDAVGCVQAIDAYNVRVTRNI
jgi:hypothetical protein